GPGHRPRRTPARTGRPRPAPARTERRRHDPPRRRLPARPPPHRVARLGPSARVLAGAAPPLVPATPVGAVPDLPAAPPVAHLRRDADADRGADADPAPPALPDGLEPGHGLADRVPRRRLER